MQLGFFTMPIHPLNKDWRVSLREDREAFILADELGFAEGYVGEHVTDKAENITSCITFIATLIDATKRIKLGTGTINMPNNHPAATAANIAMLDHLLDGRFIGPLLAQLSNSLRIIRRSYQGTRKVRGVERAQILERLPDADQLHR